MRAYILAGGLGTRMSEETKLLPKPMVQLGNRPMIWHIMKTLSSQGVSDFVVLAGYKADLIYDYFTNYHLRQGKVVISTISGVEEFSVPEEDWRVTILDTGLSTMTGGRLKQGLGEMNERNSFLFTYGDGLSNVSLSALLEVHRESKAKMTVTAVRPAGRFGSMQMSENYVMSFSEKPPGDNQWVNGGYAVVEPEIVDLIADDTTVLETDVLPRLSAQKQLGAYRHLGFWKAVDTMNDKRIMDQMIMEGNTPWMFDSNE